MRVSALIGSHLASLIWATKMVNIEHYQRRDVKHLHTVVVQGALSAPNYDDLVTDHSCRVWTTQRWQVSLHIGMGLGNKKAMSNLFSCHQRT